MILSGDLARPSGGVVQTIYLVLVRVDPTNTGDPNVELVGAKLTSSAAERVKQAYPGSWIEKILADKT